MWNVARSGEQCLVPVLALRLTHKSVNKNMAFGDSHAPRQESVYKLLNDFIPGNEQPEHMEPLDVFLHEALGHMTGMPWDNFDIAHVHPSDMSKLYMSKLSRGMPGAILT